MNLRTVHQILIVAAGWLGAIFALRSLVVFARGGGPLALALGVASVAFTVAAASYLKRFRKKLAARSSAASPDGSSARS